jgi:Carbohydrate-binding module 48 (Isoamylase N-terminal domain)
MSRPSDRSSPSPASESASASPACTPGEPWPLGAHRCHCGTNFAVFSRHATRLELWIFDDTRARVPSIRIALDSTRHRTGDIWHVRLDADLCGRCYMFRAIGLSPTDPRHRFDSQQLLLDPYAPLIATTSSAHALHQSIPLVGSRCAGLERRAIFGFISNRTCGTVGSSRTSTVVSGRDWAAHGPFNQPPSRRRYRHWPTLPNDGGNADMNSRIESLINYRKETNRGISQ